MSYRPRPLRDLALAVSTLTVLPLRVDWPKGQRTDAPGYYPLVGLLIGALGVGFARLTLSLGFAGRAPLVVAGLLVALWALATRMLHWDGLGDVADAFWAFEPARRLEIMRDSSLGAFGVTAIALCVVIQTAALAHLLDASSAWTLVTVPVLARFAATCAAWFGKPARLDGLGASVIGTPRAGAVVPALLALAAAPMLSGATPAVAALALTATGIVLALAVPHLLAMRFGGVTGDVMGASVVLVETLLFAACAMAL